MFLSPEVAILQHSTGVMQISWDYFENGITFFTNLIYTAIRFAVGSGETAPFVGHNAFLRWKGKSPFFASLSASSFSDFLLRQLSNPSATRGTNILLPFGRRVTYLKTLWLRYAYRSTAVSSASPATTAMASKRASL